MKMPIDVLNGIRRACGEDYIIGVRFGANEPTYEHGIEIAKIYAENGIDYLSATHGYPVPYDVEACKAQIPPDFPFNAIVYSGVKVKESLSRIDKLKDVPVILVNDIRTAARGEWLLEREYGDMIAYAHPLIAATDFVTRSRIDPDYNKCIRCPRCIWVGDANTCAGTDSTL
jgi:2,4-dienoyl-CoA reductase-like NADH-dependent reductase (Old Yellow Enzyme family)